jgi:hypothetical protein
MHTIQHYCHEAEVKRSVVRAEVPKLWGAPSAGRGAVGPLGGGGGARGVYMRNIYFERNMCAE